MAGQSKGEFREKLSPFLKEKLAELRATYGEDAPIVHKLAHQYIADPREQEDNDPEERRRHYEAEMPVQFEGQALRGIERLYRRVMLIEPTTVCAAHCRYCLRGLYDMAHLSEEELVTIARYCGSEANRDDVREVLITGGDPLMIPGRLNVLIDALVEHAPNVRFVRIGTRVPLHAPARINEDVLEAVRPRPKIHIEIATQINHAVDLFPEVQDAFRRLQKAGCRIYNQTVLLRTINDTPEDLIELFDMLRSLWIEAHYLFHCVPMRHMAHYRTSLDKGLRLTKQVIMSGYNSGRAKHLYTAMTDIGKITLYDGVILKREGRHLLLQSNYSVEERQRWNPSWTVPDSVEVDAGGHMRVWYLDGEDG
ncbi:MAG TPA: radical SAM protein [Candidatus Hydrogenedentes bacterium]|nr:radical SAM protein [Candidatus Hydrogenedentota bacterium]HOS02211.1 radical SAM protein [Candidatus Hydrogenedentota bacterium]